MPGCLKKIKGDRSEVGNRRFLPGVGVARPIKKAVALQEDHFSSMHSAGKAVHVFG